LAVQIQIHRASPETDRADLLAFPVAEGGGLGGPLARVDRALGGRLAERVRDCGFKGKEGDVLLHPAPQGALPSRSVVLIGVGSARGRGTRSAHGRAAAVQRTDVEPWRRFGAVVRVEARRQGARDVACALDGGIGASIVPAVAEGFTLAGYRFDRYKSDKDKRQEPERLRLLVSGRLPSAARDLARVAIVTQEVIRVRDMVNEPARVKTPSYMAEVATRIGKECGLAVEVWSGRRLEREKLAGLLAVAQGSQEPPRFIRLRYKPRGRPRKRVALIGKGLTFDSGGLSLKPAKSMETMKLDMAGGATVMAVMAAIGQLRPRVEVTGYVPATENMPGGRAQKPGDVIRYMNGKTVEVLNTDAEGRLILADALALACRAKPDIIIDLATLTGACMVALGAQVAGIMGNDEDLVRRLIACGREAGEALWQLPLVREYREEIRSGIADIKNVGGQYGGTITAGLFLQEFVDGPAWAHVDIAGPAFAEKDLPYVPRGGTGFGIRTLVNYLQSL
jgi:leucyl aminopeptidase